MDKHDPIRVSFSDRDIRGLHCKPQVLVALIEACLGQDNSQNLTDIILQDAALSARVILAAGKTGTGASYAAAAEPVSSAVHKLGAPVLISIALQAARHIADLHYTDDELVFQYRLWCSAQIGGTVARCLAPSVDFARIEEAQLCGLFLNFGIQLLFSRYRGDYLVMNVGSCGNSAQSLLEKGRFGVDHLEVADEIIKALRLNSFVADAVRFLHADIAQIEQSSPLLKIARFTHQLCQLPLDMSEELQALAERLFGLSRSETGYLYQWARDLFPADLDMLEQPDVIRTDMEAALRRLNELVFLLADQEAARARLADTRQQQELLETARRLFLERSAAREVFFFLLDHQSNHLTGMGLTDEQSLVRELVLPLQRDFCLLTNAVLDRKPWHSSVAEGPLTVTDHLIKRLCHDRAFVCYPLFSGDLNLGGVVLEVDSDSIGQEEALPYQMLCQVVGQALKTTPSALAEPFGETGSLLRRVSHEVSNPLTIIGNYAEVLSRSSSDPENVRLTATIKNESRRIDEVINYYLNQQETSFLLGEGIDLNQLVRDCVASMKETEFEPRRIDVKLNLSSDLEDIVTSPVLIRQILTNLIKNAAEALNDGGTIEITTRIHYIASRGFQAEITVHDNGPGIAQPVLKNLFKSVASTKGVGHAGVGLSIVKGMVDDLGGQISCHSTQISGTSFQVQIPYKRESAIVQQGEM